MTIDELRIDFANPYHRPPGSAKGGQFAPKPGGKGSKGTGGVPAGAAGAATPAPTPTTPAAAGTPPPTRTKYKLGSKWVAAGTPGAKAITFVVKPKGSKTAGAGAAAPVTAPATPAPVKPVAAPVAPAPAPAKPAVTPTSAPATPAPAPAPGTRTKYKLGGKWVAAGTPGATAITFQVKPKGATATTPATPPATPAATPVKPAAPAAPTPAAPAPAKPASTSKFFQGDFDKATVAEILAGSSKEIQDLAKSSGILATDDASHTYALKVKASFGPGFNETAIKAGERIIEMRASADGIKRIYDAVAKDLGKGFPEDWVKVGIETRVRSAPSATPKSIRKTLEAADAPMRDLQLASSAAYIRSQIRKLTPQDWAGIESAARGRVNPDHLKELKQGDLHNIDSRTLQTLVESTPKLNALTKGAHESIWINLKENSHYSGWSGFMTGLRIGYLADIGDRVLAPEKARLEAEPNQFVKAAILRKAAREALGRAYAKALKDDGIDLDKETLAQVDDKIITQTNLVSRKNIDSAAISRTPSAPACLSSVDKATHARIKSKVSQEHDQDEHGSFMVEVNGIFRIKPPDGHAERYEAERKRVDNEMDGLYHGTGYSVSAHIGGGGFIVPKEAKVGRMFGNGVYLADKSSKSAQYIGTDFGRDSTESGALIISKASLGRVKTVDKAYNAEQEEGAQAWGKYETLFGRKWAGATPSPGSLKNNEWAVHNPNAVLPQYMVDITRKHR